MRISDWSSDVCSSDLAERWNALDILVLNAAMLGSLTPVSAIDTKEFARLITINMTAQQALIAAFDPLLRKSEDAHLVALTSSVAKHTRDYWGDNVASQEDDRQNAVSGKGGETRVT